MVWRSHHYQNKRLYIRKSKLKITNAVTVCEFDWFTSCRAIDAMVFFSTPFGGRQELTLIGAEQTTSSLVVMICIKNTTGSAGACKKVRRLSKQRQCPTISHIVSTAQSFSVLSVKNRPQRKNPSRSIQRKNLGYFSENGVCEHN